MADNDDTLLDGYGNASDWIEIHNAGDDAIDLSGWYLTDDREQLSKWAFPNRPGGLLGAGEYLVVFASGQDSGAPDPAGYLHADFRLSADGEYLALVRPDGVSVASAYAPDGTEYPAQLQDVSYGLGYEVSAVPLVAQGASVNVIIPTEETDSNLGDRWKGGDETGFQAVGGLADWSTGTTTGVGFDGDSEYGDLIGTDLSESLYNVGTSAYLRIPFVVEDLAGITSLTLNMLYDDAFVAYLNGQEIARNNVTGTPTWDTSVPTMNHTADDFEAFEISQHIASLEPGHNVLAIHGINRTRRSSSFLVLPELIADVVSGVADVGYFPVPSPGMANGTSVQGFVDGPHFSVQRGLYSAPFDTVITSATPGATIIYTTDGSRPTLSNGIQIPAADPSTYPAATLRVPSTMTVRAVVIKPQYEPTDVDTHSYLFLDDVAGQPAFPKGYPTNWAGNPADYQVDPDVTQDPLYRDTFVDDLGSVPIVSLVTDVGHLFDRDTGIYVNPLEQGVEWERPVSMELLNFPGQEAFQVNAGLRIFGGVSRRLDRTPKKSFRLQFKSLYGSAKLEFPFFEDSSVTEFDRLMLRGGYNYKWTHADSTQQNRAQYMRDQFSRDSQLAMGQPSSHGRYVHVYLNGLYWGMYNAVERPDESFAIQLGRRPRKTMMSSSMGNRRKPSVEIG